MGTAAHPARTRFSWWVVRYGLAVPQGTATLDWVKKRGPLAPFEPVSGVQGSNVRVFARSKWVTRAPEQFTIWEKLWWARIARALGFKQPTGHILVLDPPQGNLSVSEGWTASPPDVPGQAEYYFEDEESARSGTIRVTTKKVATVFKQVGIGGAVASAGPHGLDLRVPFSATGETTLTHELGPVVDPDVTVQLLYPWGEDEYDLGEVVLQWIEANNLGGSLLDAVAGAGRGAPDPRAALQAISDGFLSRESEGWEIWLGGGKPRTERDGWRERQFAIEAEQPRDLTVTVRPPTRGGRMSYALRVTDTDGEVVTGGVVELEAEDAGLWIREGLPEWPSGSRGLPGSDARGGWEVAGARACRTRQDTRAYSRDLVGVSPLTGSDDHPVDAGSSVARGVLFAGTGEPRLPFPDGKTGEPAGAGGVAQHLAGG